MVNFKTLMEEYKFDNFPRNVGRVRWDNETKTGSLFQYQVNSFSEFFHEVWDVAKGHQVYTSHNSVKNGMTFYRQMAFDVDTDKSGTTLEMALDDMKKLVKYFEKADKMASFSGNGFHFFLRFTEREIPIDVKLRFAIKEFQKNLVERLSLKTVNLSCAEPKRIIRIPGTMHSEDTLEKGLRYCIPVNEELLDEGMDAILLASKKRDVNHYFDNKDKQKLSLDKMLRLGENAVVLEVIDQDNTEVETDLRNLNDNEFLETMSWILGDKLVEKLMTQKPGNKVLVYSCIVLYNMRVPLESALYVYDKFAELAKWYNGKNVEKRHYSIRKVYEGGYELWVT